VGEAVAVTVLVVGEAVEDALWGYFLYLYSMKIMD
jgi:hypothetical protein